MSSPAPAIRAPNLVSVSGDDAAAEERDAPIPPDRINELYYGQILNAATQAIARERIHWMCAQARGKRLLDVGCSQGIASILLAREGFEAVGIDSRPEAIRFAEAEREREIGSVRGRLSFIQVDLQNLESQTFDTVVAGEVVEHQANPRRFIERCTKLLAEDGVLVLTTPFGLHPHADHKATLLPRDVVEAVQSVLELESIDVVDGYIRCTASRREATRRRPADGAAMLLRITEQGTRAAQSRLYGQLAHKSEQIRKQSAAAAKGQARIAELEQAKAEALSRLLLAQKDAEAKAAEVAAAKGARVEIQEQLDRARAALESERRKAAEETETRRAAQARLAEADTVLAEARARAEAAAELTAQMRRRAEAAEVKAAELARRLAAGERAQHETRAALAEQTGIAADARQRAGQSAARTAALETEIARLEDAQATLRTDLWAARRAERAAEHKADRLAVALEAAKDDHAVTERRLAEALSRARDAEQARLGADEHARHAEARATALEERIVELEQAHQTLHGEIAEIEQEVERLARGAHELRTTLDRLEADNARLREHSTSMERTADAARKARDEARTTLDRLEADNARLREHSTSMERAADAARKARDEAEAQARHEALKAKRETDRLRRVVADLERSLEASRETISFRLGYALLHGTRSVSALRALPGELMALRREARRRRRRQVDRVPDGRGNQAAAGVGAAEREVLSEVLTLAATDGAAAVRDRVLAMDHQPALKARLLTEVAKTTRASDPTTAVMLGREAYRLDAKAFRAKWLASAMYDAGLIDEPARLIERAEADGVAMTGKEAIRAGVIRGLQRVRSDGVPIPERAEPAFAPAPRRVLYLASRSLPHDVVGYTMRTQGLVQALQAAGWDMQVATRVGYAGGQEPGSGARHDEVDGVRYARLAGPSAASTPLDHYVDQAAAVLTEHARALRPALVHAASNHVNALPALIAARRLGLPFVYEVRGLWEYTSAARIPGWEDSERFALMRDLEGQVARAADLVLTLSEALKAELAARGVEPARIRIVPNAVDIERFSPRPRDQALAGSLGLEHRFVIGFLGSLVGYEGLEDLVDATAELRRRGVDAALLVVGEGEAAASIRARAQEQGIAERVELVGRVPASEVPRYYSLIDVAAFPRLPVRVCELVPPLKPFEAMAMAKPVVASDLPALRELVEHGRTGLLFPGGDVRALSERLDQLARDPGRRQELGGNARTLTAAGRTWQAAAAGVAQSYERLGVTREPLAGRADPAEPGGATMAEHLLPA